MIAPLKKRISQFDGSIDNASNVKQRKLLCIRADILSDRPTPQEDSALRMEYQVSLLQKGMGRQHQGGDSAKSLAIEWLDTGYVSNEHYSALFSRFNEAWKRL